MQIKVSCLFISIALLAGCKQTQDEEREALFKPKFEQAMDDKDYCKAVEMANSRFNYTENPDRAVDRKKQYKRVQQWLKAGKEAEVECNKLKWVAIKQQYEKEIQVLRQQLSRLEQLRQQFTVILNKNDVVTHENSGYKYTPLRISNHTSYTVTRFKLDYDSFDHVPNQKGFDYPYDLGLVGYDFNLRSNPPVFEPDSDSSFDIRVVDTPNPESLPDRVVIPLLSISTLENGEPQTYEFQQIDQIKRNIASIQHRLKTEDPNNTSNSND